MAPIAPHGARYIPPAPPLIMAFDDASGGRKQIVTRAII